MIHLELPLGPPGQDADEFGFCCYGAACEGLHRCTCWEPVYSDEQEPPRADLPTITRAKCCHDCAYRNGSPERERGEDEDLRELALAAAFDDDAPPFYCHDGMRRIVAWRHPDGREVPDGPGNYAPPKSDGRAFRADGTPADRCGGWAACVAGYRDSCA